MMCSVTIRTMQMPQSRSKAWFLSFITFTLKGGTAKDAPAHNELKIDAK